MTEKLQKAIAWAERAAERWSAAWAEVGAPPEAHDMAEAIGSLVAAVREAMPEPVGAVQAAEPQRVQGPDMPEILPDAPVFPQPYSGGGSERHPAEWGPPASALSVPPEPGSATITVAWSPEDDCYVARVVGKSLATHGGSMERALREMAVVIDDEPERVHGPECTQCCGVGSHGEPPMRCGACDGSGIDPIAMLQAQRPKSPPAEPVQAAGTCVWAEDRSVQVGALTRIIYRTACRGYRICPGDIWCPGCGKRIVVKEGGGA